MDPVEQEKKKRTHTQSHSHTHNTYVHIHSSNSEQERQKHYEEETGVWVHSHRAAAAILNCSRSWKGTQHLGKFHHLRFSFFLFVVSRKNLPFLQRRTVTCAVPTSSSVCESVCRGFLLLCKPVYIISDSRVITVITVYCLQLLGNWRHGLHSRLSHMTLSLWFWDFEKLSLNPRMK